MEEVTHYDYMMHGGVKVHKRYCENQKDKKETKTADHKLTIKANISPITDIQECITTQEVVQEVLVPNS